eukprot:TRINITY_DN4857_c0_g1_i1.p1 TRINITY_DN4857_c0_g1~~TRINITY_DN4857_c0_g1_i1.p1  ORF type:complete len:456 (-),score=142.46 TRINITY_DN4857_c0_g1_i1:84-1319(-)
MALNTSDGLDDLELEIPVNTIFEEFMCPICMCPIKDCHSTDCGHNFCKDCVLECLNRKHTCPFCNHPTTKDKILKNHHFDKLLAIVTSEKQAASKRYFDKMINNATKTPTPTPAAGGDNTAQAQNKPQFSPIEQLFHKYLTKILLAYEEYYKELKRKYERNVAKVKEDYSQKMTEVVNQYQQKEKNPLALSASKEEEIRRLKEECEKKVQELDSSFALSTNLLLEAYEKYLKELAPVPSYLPVTVSVSIVSKGLKFDGVQISTTDTAVELKEILKAKLQESGNPLLSPFSASNLFVLKRKFEEKAEDIVLFDENRPLVQYKIDPGDLIYLKGEVQLLSDKPKECFAANFVAGTKVDYFSCKTCGINWVCRTCAETCHKGHVVTNYIMNHAPSWACCYCPKNKKCTILNKAK